MIGNKLKVCRFTSHVHLSRLHIRKMSSQRIDITPLLKYIVIPLTISSLIVGIAYIVPWIVWLAFFVFVAVTDFYNSTITVKKDTLPSINKLILAVLTASMMIELIIQVPHIALFMFFLYIHITNLRYTVNFDSSTIIFQLVN